MTKQKSNLLQRTIVILLSIVLTVGTVCNTVPANVFAQEKDTVQYEGGMTNERTADIAENIISSDEEWGAQTLAAGIYTINSGVTVTMTGQVTVSGDVTIKGGGKLVRGASEAYFSVSGSSLTLQNIEIDGASLGSDYAMAEVTNNGRVTLSDGCWIHHCYKNISGGAVFMLQQSSAVFEDAIIENCQATSYGGAIYITDGSSLIINDGTYQKNSTSSTKAYGGGFIYNASAKLEIYGGRFIDNTSGGKGGCIYNTGLESTETYLYDGYFQGNKSFYNSSNGKGSGAIFYSSVNTQATTIQLSGNVQFRGDDTAGSGIDGIFLDFAETAQRKAQISSELKYPTMLYLKAEEGRVIAQGADGYKLQKKDMKKIAFTDVGTSGSVWYAKLDEENNQVILTKTNPGYQLYVTYVSNGAEGNVLDENGYNSGDTVIVQSKDGLNHRDAYIFDGWNTKPDGTGTTYQAGSAFKISEDVTLYAQWMKGPKVIYDYAANGGNSATQTSVGVRSGEEIDLTPTAMKTGWEFVGWNTDPEAEEGLVSLEMGTEDIILYAIYKKDLTLTFYSGKAGEKETQQTTLYNKQENITFTFPELKDLDVSEVNGYTAYGWSDDKDSVSAISEENASGQASEDMTFYGTYQKEINISYDANNGSGNVPKSQTMINYAIVSDAECGFYTKDSEIVKLEDGTGLSRIGYTFNGWIEGSETGNPIPAGTTVNPTEDTVYYASWVLAVYKVTLHTNDGDSGTTLDSYTYGTGAVLPANWAKKGYTFDGWFDNENLTGTAVTDISDKDTGDKEYWAKWNPVSYTITYNLNGGMTSGNPLSYTIESDDIILNNPTKEGYTFIGWSGTDLEGSNHTNVAIMKGSIGDRTYIANWALAVYKVTLHTNDGDSGTTLDSYTYGTGAVLPANWAKKGYTFDGWFDNENLTGTAVTDISDKDTGDKEYWAKWSLVSYTITYNLDGGMTNGNPLSYTIESDDIILNNPTKEEYIFTGWSGTDLTGNNTNVTITKGSTGNRTYTANWAMEVYNVTLHTNGGDGGTDLVSYTYGEGADLPADWTKKGYTFDGWFDNESLTGTAVTNISDKAAGDKEYWAKWNPVSYTITYNLDGGMTSGNPLSYTIESDDIILNNPTKEGYTFIGWSGTDLTGSNNTDVTIKKGSIGDHTYTANWAPAIYKVTLHTNGGNSGTNLDSYIYGKGAVLPADWTKKGYTFDGWFDNESLTGTAVTNISDKAAGDKEYWAKWNPVSYTITYNLDGGTTSGNPLSYTIESDDIILNNPTKEGYNFTGWSGTDLTGNTTDVTITKGSTGNRTYTANWVPAAYNVTLHTNGGDGGTDLASYTYGEGAVLPLDWTKKGYTFDGWFDNENLTGTAVTDISNKAAGDKEYWAKWIDNIPPVLGTLSYSYEPKNLWQWLIGKESLIITVPVTEEGSGADQIIYKIMPENGNTSMNAAEIKNGAAKIIIDADFKGTISITCTDKAGNISSDKTAGAEYNGFIIEDNAPQIDIQTDSTSVQGEYMAAPAITVSVTDDKDNAVSAGISSVTYKIGSNAETAIQQDFTTSMKTSVTFMIPADKIPAGETVIVVTATDNAGNQNTITKTIKVHIHSGTLIPATAADCTTSGNMEYYTCSCGKWFSDSECTAEITNDTDIIIKALGHDFSVIQCDETGHWKKCSRCAEKQPIEAHIEDEGIVTKEATATDTGIKTYKCTVCGYVMRTEIIPSTGSGEEKPVSGNIIVAAPVISDGAPDGDFVDTLDEVKKAVILTQEERTEIANGIDVNIWLDIKPVTPDENKKTLIEAKKGDYTIGTYMDISMFKQVGDKTPNFVSRLNKKIKISIVIPEELRNTDNSVERIYRVLHYHDTEAQAEVLTGTYDEKTFTYIFETDRFSTYAIAYKDSKEPTVSNENNNSSTPTDTIKEDNTPKTNDSEIPEIWLWVLALVGIGVICFGKMAADK